MNNKLLFVDDDKVICNIAKSFLERKGDLTVDTALSADEAYRILKDNYYDAIISDYDMPEKDGITFLKRIRKDKNSIPFVILTGKGQEKMIIEALNNGADLYFEKAESPGDLFSNIHDKLVPLIRSRRALVLFEKIFTQSPIAIELFSYDGKLLDANQACLDLFGIINPDEIINFDIFQDPNIPPEYLINLKAGNGVEYSDIFNFELVKQKNLYQTSRSGKIFTEVQITPLLHIHDTYDPHKIAPLGYLVMVQDLTEQKKYERELKLSEERYRSIFFNNHAVMMILDPASGKIVDANPAACRYYEYSYENLTRLKIWDINIISEEDVKNEMKRAIDGDKNFFQFQHKLASGELREVESHTGPICIDNTVYLYSIINDVTDKKRAEDALQIANKKLNMLSSITRHDILNILTALTGYLEFAGTETSIEETRRFIEKARVATKSIRHHINFTRDYQDLGTKEPMWYDIGSILQTSKSLLDLGQVKVSFESATGLVILADPLLIKVIYNIMENSIRHGKTVTLISSNWVKNQDGGVNWIIEDNGTGIPENQKKDVFKREFGKNTGFGLFLAREILAITGITIKETGYEGKGVRFEILIPEGKYRIESK